MTSTLSAYLPQDRRRALATGQVLPDSTRGSVLFADISGFTPLTEALTQALGPRRGAEVLTGQLNAVYDALIAEVERYGGSVTGFAGDSIVCWFDESGGEAAPAESARRAVACALGLQMAMARFSAVPLPDGSTIALALKAAVASGPARRFVVGDPETQLIEALAGSPISRTAAAEHLAQPGEVLVDPPTVEVLQGSLHMQAWRADPQTGELFAVVQDLQGAVELPARELPSLDSETVRPWLLPPVFAREQSGQGTFLTEFRPAATLFLRFEGLDFNSDASGPQLDTFIRQAQGILRRYEGVLLQLTIGDKGNYLYAAFGAPLAHEDDARRAVKAALELNKAGDYLDFLEPVQIGLSRGTMRAGVYGSQTRHVYGVMGEDANLAARLMSQAAPGEILVSGRVHQVVAPEFAFEPRPTILLKGKAEPLPVFRLMGAQQRRAIRLQEPAYALPLIGRLTELNTIAAKMELALQGKGQVVGIVAEAGLGKSRLMAEAIRTSRRKGFMGYGGACQSDGVNTPYLVWKPVWSAFFNVDPDLPLHKQVRHLQGEIEDRAPQRVAALPLLGAVLGLPIPDNDFTGALDPQIRRSALHALLEECLKAAAREAPLLLVFEDLQWMDAISHDLLEELARATAAFPVCFMLAYRSPQLQRLQAPRLEALPNFTKITLSELSPAECEQAIRAKLAQLYPARRGSVPSGLVEKLVLRSQGNPFYLEELLNYMHDRGLDPLDANVLSRIELPDSLHALILSRMDQLAENEKTVLRVASIIGRLFRAAWLPGYYPALGELAQVKAVLDELDRLEITLQEAPEPELAYLFKHIVTHEVAYESLPYVTRARLHEQLARYLERTYPDASPLDALAYHYGQTANTAKQRDVFQKAGDAASAAFANEAALNYYTLLLPLLAEPEEQAGLHLQMGAVLERMGRWQEAEAHYQNARELAAQDPVRTALCQLALGKLCRLRGDFPSALAWLERAQQGWSTLQDPAGLGQALVETGQVLWRQGAYAAARQRLEEGLARAREAGDRLTMALALNSLGNIAYQQGDFKAAWALYEQSLDLRRELSDKPGLAISLNNLGSVAMQLGDYVQAGVLHEQSLALKREMGDKWGISASLMNAGNVAYQQGDYPAARALYEESLALKREIGDRRGISITLTNLGFAIYNQGDYAAARALFEEGLVLKRELSDKEGIAESLNALALVALDYGNLAAARALHEESLALSVELGSKPVLVYTLLGLAGVSWQEGAAAQAVRLAAAAETLRLGIQYTPDPVFNRKYHATIASAQAALGEEAFSIAWAEGQAWAGGQALSLEEAVALARKVQ